MVISSPLATRSSSWEKCVFASHAPTKERERLEQLEVAGIKTGTYIAYSFVIFAFAAIPSLVAACRAVYSAVYSAFHIGTVFEVGKALLHPLRPSQDGFPPAFTGANPAARPKMPKSH
jgi:hypothetical protein